MSYKRNRYLDLEQEVKLTAYLEKATKTKNRLVFYDYNGSTKVISYETLLNNALKLGILLKQHNIQNKVIFQISDPYNFIVTFWACLLENIEPYLCNKPSSFNSNSSDFALITTLMNSDNEIRLIVDKNLHDKYVNAFSKLGINKNKIVNLDNLKRLKDDLADKEDILKGSPSVDKEKVMFFSSGSTGQPKGIEHTNDSIIKRNLEEISFLKSYNCVLNWMPLEHIAALVMTHIKAVMTCSQQVIVDTRYILEKPIRWLYLMDKYKVDFSWSPHFAYVLLNKAIGDSKVSFDLSHLKTLIDGGEMIDKKSAQNFVNQMCKFGAPKNVLVPAWGLSETCSAITLNTNGFTDKDGNLSVGVPLSGVEIKILDEEGNLLKDRENGIINVRSPYVIDKYSNNKSCKKNGYFDTGDIGYISNGHLFITGRSKDLIIINGKNYNLSDIETSVDREFQGLIVETYTTLCVLNNDLRNEYVLGVVCEENIDKNKVSKKIRQFIFLNYGIGVKIFFLKKCQVKKTAIGKKRREQMKKVFLNKEVEDKIIQIWKSVFNDDINSDSDFFGLGGTSIDLIRLQSDIEETFNIKMDIDTLFEIPNIKDQIKYVEEKINEK